MDNQPWQRAEPLAAAGLLALGVVLLLVLVASGTSLWALAVAAVGVLLVCLATAVHAWRREAADAARRQAELARSRGEVARADEARRAHERALAAAEAELKAVRDRAAAEADRAEHDRRHLQQALRRAEDSATHQRELLRRVEASRRAEREWNRELRAQLQHLYESRGGMGRLGDVRALILQATIQLVEAEKGMLLSREDADGDGDLDVVASYGFDNDPAESAIAQRFARRVLAADEIVREQAPSAETDGLTAADEEIDALVAIPIYLRDRLHGVIVCANRPDGFEEFDDDVLIALGDHAGAALHQGQLRNEVQRAHQSAVRALLEALEIADPRRHGESARLCVHALTLARDLGFENRQRDVLVWATLLRHAGYLALPVERILNEPRALGPDERAVIELHPRIGFDIIGQVPVLRDVAAAVLYHHERFDGRGYPAGLAGTDIPVTARALAVLEAYSAMTADRPGREQLTPEEACGELVAAAGTQFDPEITQLLVEQIRSGRAEVDDELAQVVMDALPLGALPETDDDLLGMPAATIDGLTSLGNLRALVRDLRADRDGRRLAVALIQLDDLPDVNEQVGYEAGDRMIQLAARNAQRIAGRCGGRAYRTTGRRLAVVVPVRDEDEAAKVVDELRIEFAGGPSVRFALSMLEPDERSSAALERARRELVHSS
jgi:HD-GYP domain-containing protein (c-di-GMP phosphodiesterase class II)